MAGFVKTFEPQIEKHYAHKKTFRDMAVVFGYL